MADSASSELTTIAICTLNRSSQLLRVLDDLDQQFSSASGEVEVLVVDNGSEDDTLEVLGKRPVGVLLRVITEPRLGLSFARNRALREARGPYIIFLDDDIRLSAGWYTGMRRALVESGRIGVGGAVVSTWPARFPSWIGDTTSPPFPMVTVHYVPSSSARAIGINDPLPFGTNLGLRLDLARQIGFREDIGHVGTRTVGGEDSDFCRRYIASFGPLWYEPTIRVEHPVAPSRLSLRKSFGYLFRASAAESWYNPPPAGGRRIGPIPFWLGRKMFVGTGRALTGLLTCNSRLAVEGIGVMVTSAGAAWGIMRPPHR